MPYSAGLILGHGIHDAEEMLPKCAARIEAAAHATEAA